MVQCTAAAAAAAAAVAEFLISRDEDRYFRQPHLQLQLTVGGVCYPVPVCILLEIGSTGSTGSVRRITAGTESATTTVLTKCCF